MHIATEVALLFLLLVGCEYAVRGTGVGFVGVEPSPLWLPIVWAAIRGGLLPGLGAAVAAGLLHTVGYAGIAGLEADMLIVPEVTWPVIVFAGVAFVVGQLRDVVEAARVAAVEDAEQWRERAAASQTGLELLQHANRELKRRIFDRSFDFQSVMSVVARTSDAADEQLFEVPLGMLVDFCGASKCSALFVLPGGVIDLAAHRGWSDDEVHERLQAARHNQRVLRAVADARPVVTLNDDDVEQGGALLVAPLADSTGVIKAVLCIDELPPSRFDQTTVKTFLGVASWVANNLRKIEMGGEQTESLQSVVQLLMDSKAIGTPEQLSARLYLEDARRSRYGIETVLIAVRLGDVRRHADGNIEAIENYVSGVLASVIRLTDDGFRFGLAGCYVLVLCGCQSEHTQTVVTRLRDRFAVKAIVDIGQVELEVFLPDQEAPSLAAQLPRITRYFLGSAEHGVEPRCPVPEPSAQRSGDARDFVRRLRLEIDLARRQDWELHLADFRGDPQSFGIGPMMARHLWNLAGTMLRVTDGIYVLGPNRCVVLLPCTSSLDAVQIWQRLDEELARSVPNNGYESVHAEFLALTGIDTRDALSHIGGVEAAVSDEGYEPVLSDNELDQLSFTDGEFVAIGDDDGDGFDADQTATGVRPTQAESPPDPAPTRPASDEHTSEWETDMSNQRRDRSAKRRDEVQDVVVQACEQAGSQLRTTLAAAVDSVLGDAMKRLEGDLRQTAVRVRKELGESLESDLRVVSGKLRDTAGQELERELGVLVQAAAGELRVGLRSASAEEQQRARDQLATDLAGHAAEVVEREKQRAVEQMPAAFDAVREAQAEELRTVLDGIATAARETSSESLRSELLAKACELRESQQATLSEQLRESAEQLLTEQAAAMQRQLQVDVRAELERDAHAARDKVLAGMIEQITQSCASLRDEADERLRKQLEGTAAALRERQQGELERALSEDAAATRERELQALHDRLEQAWTTLRTTASEELRAELESCSQAARDQAVAGLQQQLRTTSASEGASAVKAHQQLLHEAAETHRDEAGQQLQAHLRAAADALREDSGNALREQLEATAASLREREESAMRERLQATIDAVRTAAESSAAEQASATVEGVVDDVRRRVREQGEEVGDTVRREQLETLHSALQSDANELLERAQSALHGQLDALVDGARDQVDTELRAELLQTAGELRERAVAALGEQVADSCAEVRTAVEADVRSTLERTAHEVRDAADEGLRARLQASAEAVGDGAAAALQQQLRAASQTAEGDAATRLGAMLDKVAREVCQQAGQGLRDGLRATGDELRQQADDELRRQLQGAADEQRARSLDELHDELGAAAKALRHGADAHVREALRATADELQQQAVAALHEQLPAAAEAITGRSGEQVAEQLRNVVDGICRAADAQLRTALESTARELCQQAGQGLREGLRASAISERVQAQQVVEQEFQRAAEAIRRNLHVDVQAVVESLADDVADADADAPRGEAPR